MNLFDVLGDGKRMLLCSDADTQTLITWNGACQLQSWRDIGGGFFQERNVQTLSERPQDFGQAYDCGMLWWNDLSDQNLL